jgi:hypothetical protein
MEVREVWMRVLLFSDIHSDLAALRRLASQQADWYICAGDLVSWARGLDACGDILQPWGARLLVLPGNHEDEAGVAAFCQKFGFQAVHRRQMELGGRRFAFLGYSNPTPFDTPGEYTEAELERHLDAFRPAVSGAPVPDVLVCHCPPHGTPLDRMRNGQHAGSTAIRRFLDDVQPTWFFSGHIHETEGTTVQLGATTAHNPGKGGYLLELM